MDKTKVSDSELDAAAEAAEETAAEEVKEEENEEEKEEEGAEEEKGEEEAEEAAEEHKESSRLGRKVASLEQRLERAVAQLETKPEHEEEVDESAYVSLKDVKTLMAKEKAREEDEKKDYNSKYLQAAISLSEGEDEEFANQVLDEMDANFNSLYSKDAARDAELNYLKAQNAVLRKGGSKDKANPLKGKKPVAALGVTGGDTNTKSTFKMPELDEYAKDLIKASNFTEEQIKRALEKKPLRAAGEHPIKNV